MTATKNADFDNIRTPSAFYCIFENSKVSQALNRSKKITFFNKQVNVRSKPLDFQDINWLNATMKHGWHNCRKVFFYYFALNAAFWLFLLVFSSFTDWNLDYEYTKKIPGIDCDDVRETFGDGIV